MSHISRIQLDVNNLNCLEKAVKKLGGTFHKNKTEFSYYAGRKGKCLHAASFPNCSYDLGIVQGENNKSFGLEWDSFSQGGLTKVLGTNADKLKQLYTSFVVKDQAMKEGNTVVEKVLQDGTIKMVISIN